MKVELTKQGRFVITAENDKDNHVLFEFTNSTKLKGVKLHFGVKEVAESKISPSVLAPKRRKGVYTKQCPVEGCDESAKYTALHMRLRHGIWDDEAHEEVYQNAVGRKVKVAKPVVKLPDGTFKVRQTKGLLD